MWATSLEVILTFCLFIQHQIVRLSRSKLVPCLCYCIVMLNMIEYKTTILVEYKNCQIAISFKHFIQKSRMPILTIIYQFVLDRCLSA